MSGRPVFYPQLGSYFESLRLARGLGLRQAAQIASNRGLKALTRSAIFLLEKGKTKNPDRELLEAIGQLYSEPYESVIANVIAHQYGLAVDPASLSSSRQTGAKPRPVALLDDAPRLLEERRRRDLRSAKQLQKAMTAIGDVVIALRADPEAAKRSARDKRKTG